jgi:hypothetical protein
MRAHRVADRFESLDPAPLGVTPGGEERERPRERGELEPRGGDAAAVDRGRGIREGLLQELGKSIEDQALHGVARIDVALKRRAELPREEEHAGVLARAVVPERTGSLPPASERLRGLLVVGRVRSAGEILLPGACLGEDRAGQLGLPVGAAVGAGDQGERFGPEGHAGERARLDEGSA